MSSANKVIVSACLLGERVRYDGASKRDDGVIAYLEENALEAVAFCPEAPLFGTPRPRISVIACGEKRCVRVDESGEDVTAPLARYIETFLRTHGDTKEAILKSKSPSCGYMTTPICNEAREAVGLSSGTAAEMFAARGLHVNSELDIISKKMS